MLQRLEISNIALIDNISVEFEDGMNVMTGETGAGKSIIIDSINAILGSRMSREIIRTGQETANVTAVFFNENDDLNCKLQEQGIEPEEDGTLIISREFNANGKNLCRVNSKIVTLSFLKEISAFLVDVHGQHDNQSLLRTESHIDLLDSFGGEELEDKLKEYREYFSEYNDLKKKINYFNSDLGDKERRIDLLKFQVDEIESSKLVPGEDEELEARKNILLSSEKISTTLNRVYEMIYASENDAPEMSNLSAYDSVAEANKELLEIVGLDKKYSDFSSKVDELEFQLQELAEEIRDEFELVEYNPEEIENIEERLDLIFKLKRKYGSTIDDILVYCEQASSELQELDNRKENSDKLNKRLEIVDSKLKDATYEISQLRHVAADKLEQGILQHMKELEMKNSGFKVSFEKFDEYTSNGIDKIEFLVSTNLGEPVKPLSKIASGGEMSRIMLAIKTMLADFDNVPTLIFDEIDTGISGRAAIKVGEKMRCISQKHQVIAVTHLPQIAVCANNNQYVEKITKDNNTLTRVKTLKDEELETEIARLLDGNEISDITLAHAKEMLRNAKRC